MSRQGKSKITKKISLVSHYSVSSDEEGSQHATTEEESEYEEETEKREENEEEKVTTILKDQDQAQTSFELADKKEDYNNISSISDEQAMHDENVAKQEETSTESVETLKLVIEQGFMPGSENIKLPSAPKAECSKRLQDKIIQVQERMNKYNYNINEDIQTKKHFKNPNIYEKFIEKFELDEFGSSFPSHVEDLKASGYLFYDELDVAQRNEWAKRDKEKKDAKLKIEVISGTKPRKP